METSEFIRIFPLPPSSKKEKIDILVERFDCDRFNECRKEGKYTEIQTDEYRIELENKTREEIDELYQKIIE